MGVIPARFQSTRFPGKPLVDIAGKPMIQRVYEQCAKATSLASLVVATDDERIAETVISFGGRVEMTRSDHPSGTMRVMEVADKYPDFDAYINIQGDEPLIDPEQINALGELMLARQGAFVGTLIKLLNLKRDLNNPNVIKVVRQKSGKAIYFSRSVIPYLRPPRELEAYHREFGYYKHIGMYGYSKAATQEIKGMQQGGLELAEALEQLTWLENGIEIWTAVTEKETIGVDSPEDIQKVLDLLKETNLD